MLCYKPDLLAISLLGIRFAQEAWNFISYPFLTPQSDSTMWRQCFSRTVQMLVVAYLLYVCDSVLPVTIIYIFYRIIVTSSFQVSFPFYALHSGHCFSNKTCLDGRCYILILWPIKRHEILKGFFPSQNFVNVARSRLRPFCVILTLTLVNVWRKSFASANCNFTQCWR